MKYVKIRVISSKDEIDMQYDDEEIVHLAFRPSNKDILLLVQKFPKLKAIHLPTSYKKTISSSTLMFLEMKNIAFLEGGIWSHKKDIYEYYEVKPRVFDRIKELRNEGIPNEEIITRLGMETQLSKELIPFLI